MTTVCNHRSKDRQRAEQEDRYVYIGRPSKWGNPFSHIPSTRYRTIRVASVEEAVRCFEEWFLGEETHDEVNAVRESWGHKPQATKRLRREAVEELEDRVLGCFGCDPCHGHVIAEYVNACV